MAEGWVLNASPYCLRYGWAGARTFLSAATSKWKCALNLLPFLRCYRCCGQECPRSAANN